MGGHRDSINDNDDKDGSPIKREKNRKRSRDNEDTSPSDTEWQHGGFKGNISPLTPPPLMAKSPKTSLQQKYNSSNISNCCDDEAQETSLHVDIVPIDKPNSQPNECLSVQERITPIKREPRKRKPAKRYSTSEYDSDDTNGNMECKSIPKAKSMDTFPKMADKSIEAFESQLQDEKNAYLDYAGYLPRSVIQKCAADLLTTDIDTKPLNGFGEDEIQHGIKEKKWYIEYLKKAEEDLELNVSCNESDVDDCHLP